MRRGRLLGIGSLILGIVTLTIAAQRKAAPAESTEVQWVWFDEGDPLQEAPAETRYFRRVFTIDRPVQKVVDEAQLEITADNSFVVWVNGTKVGSGNEWKNIFRFDTKKLMRNGPNVIAVEANNEGGPAGLIVKLSYVPNGQTRLALVSDKEWNSSKSAAKGWQALEFDDKNWKPVKVLGPYGKVGPWGMATAAAPGKQGPRRFTVPEGFKVEQVVKRPDDRGPFSLVNMTFDNKGRLLLSEEGGPTLLCTDLKDGMYQKVVPYCTQVTNCHGMCWVGDALLLVGNGPKGTGLYRCTDTDGDDKIDKVELLHSYQGGMGEHGPHAVLHGPDGWLYFVIGNHAHAKVDKLADNSPLTRWPTGSMGPDQGKPNTTEDVLLPRLNDANGHAANILAPGGTIWRMDLEGKNISLFSAGYRNHFDAAFSPSGELFTFDSDMEWDEALPWYRAVRVCHCTPGSDFVWRTGAANTPNYYLDSLPPLYETGRGSPVGLEFYDHHAYPAKYRGAYFMCDWSLGIIYAVHLEKKGATYKGSVEKFCTGAPLNVTDCAVGPDGALYFTMGGRGTQGGVYCIVSTEKPTAPTEPTNVDQPLAAWSRAKMTPSTLDAIAKSVADAKTTGALRARGLLLLQMHGKAPGVKQLIALAANKDADLRAAAVYLIGINGYQDAKPALIKLLDDDDAMVRRRACEAMVRARIEPTVEALGPVLVDDDIFVRTAARLVLQRIDPKKWAERALRSENKKLVREGIVALTKINAAAEHGEAIFDRLHEGSPGENVQDVLDYLRTIQLALVHTSKRPGSVRGLALDCLEMFPHKDKFVNRELAILLAGFKREKILDEAVHTKLLDALLKAKDDRMQQIHYFYCLRLIPDGWTKEQKADLLAWYDSTRSWIGGHSFHPFLVNILRDLNPAFTKEDRERALAKALEMPQAALVMLQLSPDDQLPSMAALKEMFDRLKSAKNVARGAELRQALVASIGRGKGGEAQAILRSLFDNDPPSRDAAALGLTRTMNAENWPYVVRGLETQNKQTLFEIIQALKKSPIKPKSDQPGPYRTLLLASGRLDPGNRWQVVELLRHWGGDKRFSTEDKDWKGELAAWSKWFGQSFPKEPSLPDVVGDKPVESKWKFAELLAYLEGEGKKGDGTKGRVVFEKGQCLKCHKYGKEGEGIGPDLTTVSKRFKRTDTLESLIYPSKVISDQYRSTTIVTNKGQQITGLAAPQGDMVTVLQTDGTKVTLKKSEIEQQFASLISVMPEKLLDTLTKEEIRDLFAFLESEPR
jgi:putative heme-binding domain-containing protein